MSRKLLGANFPVYTISCGVENQPKRNMVSLSRLTGARNWDLDSADPREIAAVMCWEETPTRVDVRVPEEMRDGSIRAVKVNFSDGTSAEAQVQMPQNPYSTSTPIPSAPPPTPTDITEDVHEEGGDIPIWMIILIILMAALLVGAGVFIFITMRNRDDIRPVNNNNNNNMRGGEKTEVTGGGSSYRPSYSDSGSDKTSVLVDNHSGYGYDDDDGGGSSTQLLVNDNNNPRMLYLNDMDHPENQFSASLREPITIGRNSGNRIVVHYDRSVSGSHCEIYADGSTFRIRDNNSANGTYVDGHRVADAVEISNGSVIQLGRVNFKVTIR